MTSIEKSSPVKNQLSSKKRKRVTTEWSLIESPAKCLKNTLILGKTITPLSCSDRACIQKVLSSSDDDDYITMECSTIIDFTDRTRCTLLYATNLGENAEKCETCRVAPPVKTLCTLCEAILCELHSKCMKFVRNDKYYQTRRKEMTGEEGLPEEIIPGERMCICNSCWNVYYILAFKVDEKDDQLRKCPLFVTKKKSA